MSAAFGFDAERVAREARAKADESARERPPPIIHTLADFLVMEHPPRGMVLAPIIPEKGLVMLYAPRGLGKTFVALGIAYAVASGGPFLRWAAPMPRRVLLIDGEMPAATLCERLAGFVAASPTEAAPDALRIIAADQQPQGMPDLAYPDGQKWLERHWGESPPELLVLDNLSTLAYAPRDNDADSWTPMQEWLLRLRRQGMSVLLVHHAGKGGNQRGTSRREDILDTVIALKRPSDYEPTQGARFVVALDKSRGITGTDTEPFEASLATIGKRAVWTTKSLDDALYLQAIDLFAGGASIREVGDTLGCGRSKAHRLRQRAASEGRLGSVVQ